MDQEILKIAHVYMCMCVWIYYILQGYKSQLAMLVFILLFSKVGCVLV